MLIQHAWVHDTFTDPEWQDICKDFQRLCVAAPGIVYFSMLAESPPEISDERIVFNGGKGLHCQPMFLSRRRNHEKVRNVCETRGNPYDSFATALLLIARFTVERHSGHTKAAESFRVVSNSPWRGWTLGHNLVVPGGVRLVTDVLGYPPGFIVDFHHELCVRHNKV